MRYILALAIIVMTAGIAQAEVNTNETLNIEPPKASECLVVGVGTAYKVEIEILDYEVIESEVLPVPVEYKSSIEPRQLHSSAGHTENREIYNINNDYAFDVEILNCDISENAVALNGRLG
jgi:hypothetical protein